VTNAHGRIDHRYIPSNLLIGNFNNDHYPDIARFSGNKLEIFIFQGKGYTSEPQGVREFDRQIASLRHDDFVWDNIDNLIVTFIDGGADTLFQRGGCLDLVGYPASKRSDVPRRVSEADFEIVWESEPRPYGMDCCAVGDLDNDGINELVTWWKESLYGDSAWILIYKSVGDDEYELFMEEPFYTAELPKELIFTLGYAHFWEFSEPGVYWPWRSSFCFYGGVSDIQISDVDQDGQLELTSVSKYSGSPIPCAYEVEEFSHKTSWPTYIYAFNAVDGSVCGPGTIRSTSSIFVTIARRRSTSLRSGCILVCQLSVPHP